MASRDGSPHGAAVAWLGLPAAGYYVVTIVLEDRRPMALGELVVKDPAADRRLAVADAKSLKIPPDAIEAKVVFSDLGRAR